MQRYRKRQKLNRNGASLYAGKSSPVTLFDVCSVVQDGATQSVSFDSPDRFSSQGRAGANSQDYI
jgi:hypothetical protein